MSKKNLLLAISVFCLVGCAVPGPSLLQTASTLPRGGIRLQAGVGTGLHLEETAYRKLNPTQIQAGGEPNKDQAYQRVLGMELPLLASITSGKMIYTASPDPLAEPPEKPGYSSIFAPSEITYFSCL